VYLLFSHFMLGFAREIRQRGVLSAKLSVGLDQPALVSA